MDSFNYVKGFDLFGVKARQIPCLTAKGEPTANLALKIGLLYINEDNGDMYKCIKVNGEEGLVWVKIDNKSNDSGQNPVQSDLAQNDPTQPDYVKHRTHYEESNQTVIEWDGSTEGRDSFVIGSGTFVKVSDMTPDTTELTGANLRMSMGGQEMEKPIADVQPGDGYYLAEGIVLVVQRTDITFGEYSAVAPSTGVYFISVGAALSLTYGSTIVHPLAEKWIPDSIARKTDIGQNAVQSSWAQNDPEAPDYVKDRTHYEENNQTVIEWDCNTEGRDVDATMGMLYKVSDLTPSKEDVVGGYAEVSGGEDFASGEFEITESDVSVGQGGIFIGEGICVAHETECYFENFGATITFPSPGVYFVKQGEVFAYKLTYGSTVVHPLDEKWIPDSIARKTDIGQNPVQSDLSQNDPTQPDYVKHRTHWEEGNQTVIEWDGSTEGRDTFPDSPNSAFYRISGNVPTVDEVVGGSIVYVYPDGILNIEITDAMCHQEDGVVAVGEDVAFIYIVGADAAAAAGFAPGIYAIAGYEDAVGIGAPAAYVSAFSYGSTVVHPLDEKWIPDSIARKMDIGQNPVQSDLSQNDPTQPDYVKHRTHWEEGNQTVIEWDGSTDYSDNDSFEHGGSTKVKISDIVPSVSELETALIAVTIGGNDQTMSVKDAYGDSDNWWIEQDTLIGFGNVIWVVYDTNVGGEFTGTTISSTGVYFDMSAKTAGIEHAALTYGSTIVHPLDEKWIPDSIARKTDIGQNVGLDTTLTESGKAADSKAVGDKMKELEDKIPESVPNVAAVAIDYDKTVKAIAHRGYSTKAPENTLPAYIMAKQQGYHYAECDVSLTSDGVAVLLHDSTIDRTSNGSGSISAMTYDKVSQYDFGSWKSAEYAGTKIPTFAEFIKLCRGIGMHPYIELKNNGGYSQEAVAGLVGIVKSCGMGGKVTWVSYNATFLGYVKTADSSARLGYLVDTTTEDRAAAAVTTIQSLQTEENEVFANLALAYLNDTKLQHFIDAEIPVEVYYISADVAAVTTKILEAHSYITGFCTDVCIAGKVLYEAYIQWSGDIVEKTLVSISATYSGGSVPVGTAVSGLSGVTVTAHYSDGSTATVTGYTLSGSIAEGDNTVTVTYQGKTATFTVTGTSETGGGNTGGDDSGGDVSGGAETPGTLVHSWDFTKGLTDSVGGYTAELSGATQDSSGLHLTAANNFAKLCDDIAQGDIVEVDVGALNAQDWGGKHGRLICFTDWDGGYASGIGSYGVVYRNTGEWNIWKNPWGTGGVLTAVDALANKTVRIDTGTGKAYADGVLFADNNGWRNDAYYLLLGASEQAYFDATILAVRVYRPE